MCFSWFQLSRVWLCRFLKLVQQSIPCIPSVWKQRFGVFTIWACYRLGGWFWFPFCPRPAHHSWIYLLKIFAFELMGYFVWQSVVNSFLNLVYLIPVEQSVILQICILSGSWFDKVWFSRFLYSNCQLDRVQFAVYVQASFIWTRWNSSNGPVARLLRWSVFVLCLVTYGHTCHPWIHLSPAAMAEAFFSIYCLERTPLFQKCSLSSSTTLICSIFIPKLPHYTVTLCHL